MQYGLFADAEPERSDPLASDDWLDGVPDGDAGFQGARWYQVEAYDAIVRTLATHRSCLSVLATGLGKTVIAAMLAKQWDGRVLFLAHRDELCDQARGALEAITGEFVDLEKAEYYAGNARIVVGSTPTLHKRKERFGPNHFGLIIVDECHRYLSPTFRAVVEYFSGAKVAGITATPDRTDEKALGQLFEEVAYVMDITDGIDAGYLVPVRATRVTLGEIELDGVSKSGDDLVAAQLDEQMLKAVEGMVAKTLELEPDRQGIFFGPGVRTAEYFMQKMNALRSGSCAFVHGGTEPLERKRLVADYRAGVYRYMANCAVFTEGFDAPSTDLIIMGRPTLSRSLYAQCLDATTEILTEEGWIGIDSESQANVAAYDPETGVVRWERSERMSRQLGADEDMYGIQSPGLDIRVTGGHRMVLRERQGRARVRSAWRFCEASDAPVAFDIPVSGAVSFPGSPLSDDELRFIGLLMTDGSANKHTGQAKLAPFYDRDLSGALRDMDARQFYVFVEAMWAGDGVKKTHVTDYVPKTLDICSSRLKMLERLQSMAILRGWRCNVSRSGDRDFWIARLESDCSHRTCVRNSTDGRPVWGKVDGHKGERVWCVSVSTGAIFTRRNGKVAIVGNCAGRGTRVLPGVVDALPWKGASAERREAIAGSPKTSCMLLDFVGNSKHNLASPEDVLGGSYTPAEVEKAKELTRAEPGSDVAANLRQARSVLQALATKVRAKRVDAEVRPYDPFHALGIKVSDAERYANSFGKMPATEGQVNALRTAGVPDDELRGMSKRAAGKLLNSLTERRTAGLATYKQMRQLRRFGVEGSDITFERASAAMNYITAKGWGRNGDVSKEALQEILSHTSERSK